MISINFLLTAFVIVLIPGTGVIYTVNTALTQKKAEYAGAVYLMYLAWKTWTSAGQLELDENRFATSLLKTAARGFVLSFAGLSLKLALEER